MLKMNNELVCYNKVDLAVEGRIDVLLPRMTLAEKIGQLAQITPYVPFDFDEFLRQREKAAGAAIS